MARMLLIVAALIAGAGSAAAQADDDAALLVLSADAPHGYFGLHQATQLGEPGWSLFEAVVTHHLGFVARASVLLFTRDNDLEPPVDVAQEDGYAVYEHLRSIGCDVTGRPAADLPGLAPEDFAPYDLVVYWDTVGHDPAPAIAAGVPIVTCDAGVHAPALGLGSGVAQDPLSSPHVCVVEAWGPTASLRLGERYLGRLAVGMQPIAPAPGARVLVTPSCAQSPVEAACLGSVKVLFR